MKKSKVIVPALAMIGLSSVASITGSVAWFTANRTANIDAGTYAVVKTGANLECVVSAGIGTSATDSGSTHTITTAGKLTDGSFNHKTKNIYTPNATGNAIATETALASATDENMKRGTDASDSDKVIYTAITWNVSFSVTFGVVNKDVALLLDVPNSSFAVDGGAAATTAQGFRMAFVPGATPTGSTQRATVYADLQTFENAKYVASTTNFNGTSYVANDYDLIDSAYTTAVPDTISSADTLTRPDCIGTFKFAASTKVTLPYTVVCWFEGTDPEIDDEATTFQSVIANLQFKAIDIVNE